MYACDYYILCICFHLDNILLKCNNETDASKHHPRRSSLESPQLADNFDVYRKCKILCDQLM